MSYILHIESATENCSVAVSNNELIIAELSVINTQTHSEIITVLIEQVLNSSGIEYKDLSAVSLSEGPGSYTSLRVGTSAAKAICFALEIPFISVNTLYSLALITYSKDNENAYYFSMIDARRMEIYGSLYDNSMNPIFENHPIILNEFDILKYVEKKSEILLSGNGKEKAIKFFNNPLFIDTNTVCKAENIVFPSFLKFKNLDFSDIVYFSPNYIKPPNITRSKSNIL